MDEAHERSDDRKQVREHGLQKEERDEDGAIHLVSNHIGHWRRRRLPMLLHVRIVCDLLVPDRVEDEADAVDGVHPEHLVEQEDKAVDTITNVVRMRGRGGDRALEDLAKEMDDGDHRAVEEVDAAEENESVEHEALGAGDADETRVEIEEQDAMQRDGVLYAVTEGLECRRERRAHTHSRLLG